MTNECGGSLRSSASPADVEFALKISGQQVERFERAIKAGGARAVALEILSSSGPVDMLERLLVEAVRPATKEETPEGTGLRESWTYTPNTETGQ